MELEKSIAKINTLTIDTSDQCKKTIVNFLNLLISVRDYVVKSGFVDTYLDSFELSIEVPNLLIKYNKFRSILISVVIRYQKNLANQKIKEDYYSNILNNIPQKLKHESYYFRYYSNDNLLELMDLIENLNNMKTNKEEYSELYNRILLLKFPLILSSYYYLNFRVGYSLVSRDILETLPVGSNTDNYEKCRKEILSNFDKEEKLIDQIFWLLNIIIKIITESKNLNNYTVYIDLKLLNKMVNLFNNYYFDSYIDLLSKFGEVQSTLFKSYLIKQKLINCLELLNKNGKG